MGAEASLCVHLAENQCTREEELDNINVYTDAAPTGSYLRDAPCLRPLAESICDIC
jgi:hypothetical protein